MLSSFCVVYITAPQGVKAKQLVESILKYRLAACINLIPHVQSRYWWEGKLDSAKEALLIIKTRRSHVKKLMHFVMRIHPYTVPEIIALPIIDGHKPYLQWLHKETRE